VWFLLVTPLWRRHDCPCPSFFSIDFCSPDCTLMPDAFCLLLLRSRHSVIVAALALLSEYSTARAGGHLPSPHAPVRGLGGDSSLAESCQVQCCRALLEQEATYNLGRAMHHLDLGFLAVPW
jgi:hypothetical protein